MNLQSPETKVGFFTLSALIVLLLSFFWLSGTKLFQKGYEIEAVFERIDNLRPGAPVKYIGVDVGRISRIYFEKSHVVVAMRIESQFKISQQSKAVISSAGVVGDKYIEIMPLTPGEISLEGERISGQDPVTLDQFYAITYEVINSMKEIADSIKLFTNDPAVSHSLKRSLIRFDKITTDIEKITNQMDQVDLGESLKRFEHTMALLEQIVKSNEPKLNELVNNINAASLQLANASLTANKFMEALDNQGKTTADLRETLGYAEKVAKNLETFTSSLAANDQDIDLLIDDARQTLQAIKKAAEDIDQMVNGLATGEGNLTDVKKNLNDLGSAAHKVSEYVDKFEKMHVTNSIGSGYKNEAGFLVNYGLNLELNPKNRLYLGVEDIGQTNLATLQWGVTASKLTGRAGLYKSEFGLGIDYPATSKLTFGLDLWNTESANLGLSSSYHFNKDWSFLMSGSKNVESDQNSWNIELWRHF